ncbi:hypothetical protein [Echinicola sp. 20G]|uniref:hypothetical protein n=1 Tax=Echinicola sp. 20G TaxID=2781961 RepID=UPI001910F5D0|nr:hypothetical protein [Echinicola sp. 20G]
MKQFVLLTLFTLIVSSAFCNNPEEKTFVVIFSKNELKQLDSSTKYIETNFEDKFSTKTYNGNSDAVLFIQVSECDFDKCQFGQTMVQVNRSTWKPLQEVAFRIIDLSECKENYEELLSAFYDKIDKKKAKSIQSIL